jgi:ElaB/YqjD/DUF883 family membrane-anchored ribosome-binding protein
MAAQSAGSILRSKIETGIIVGLPSHHFSRGSAFSKRIAMTTENSINTEKLVQDLKVVVADAEELLRATASQAGEHVTVAREKIQQSLERAKLKLGEAESAVFDKTRQMANVTDEYVHEHPWKAVGVAAGIGLIIGLLISRR